MQFLFSGDCNGLEALFPYETARVWPMQLRARMNPQRNYVLGTIEMDKDMADALNTVDPMEALKLIAKSPIGVIGKEMDFKKSMIENVRVYNEKKKLEKVNKEDQINEEFSKIV